MAASSQRLSSRLFGAAGSSILPFSTDSSEASEDEETDEPEPDREQKWEFESSRAPFANFQLVIIDTDDEHVFFRTMSGNEPGSMKRSTLQDRGTFVEELDFDEDNDWSLP